MTTKHYRQNHGIGLHDLQQGDIFNMRMKNGDMRKIILLTQSCDLTKEKYSKTMNLVFGLLYKLSDLTSERMKTNKKKAIYENGNSQSDLHFHVFKGCWRLDKNSSDECYVLLFSELFTIPKKGVIKDKPILGFEEAFNCNIIKYQCSLERPFTESLSSRFAYNYSRVAVDW